MNRTLLRSAGVTAVVGGLLVLARLIIGEVINQDLEQHPLSPLFSLMPLFLTTGALGLFAFTRQGQRSRVGIGLAAVGGLLMTAGIWMMDWLNNAYGWGVMAAGMLLLVPALLIYGALNLREKTLPRWNGLPMTLGALTGTALIVDAIENALVPDWRLQNDYGFWLYLATIGVGWILFGLLMLTAHMDTAVTPSAASAR